MSDQPPRIDIGPSPAQSVFELAARGDGSAFSVLAGWHRQRATQKVEPAVIAYARAVDMARLSTIARGTIEDWQHFLVLLDLNAQALREAGLIGLADQALAEIVVLAECMAEDGDEDAAQLVVQAASDLPAEVFNVTRALRARVGENP